MIMEITIGKKVLTMITGELKSKRKLHAEEFLDGWTCKPSELLG